MKNNNNTKIVMWIVIGIIAVTAILNSGGLFSGITTSTQYPEGISVSSNVQMQVPPDKATFNIEIQTKDKDAKNAQEQNSILTNQVMTALKEAGIADSELETQNYNMYPGRDYVEVVCIRAPCPPQYNDNYIVSNSIKVSTKNLDKIGIYIDAAVKAGANSVNSVNFDLSDAKRAEIQQNALKQAGQDTKAKAQAIADGMNVKLGKIKSIQEQSYNIYPQYYAYDMKASAIGAEIAPTPITPQNVNVNAQILVTYSIA